VKQSLVHSIYLGSLTFNKTQYVILYSSIFTLQMKFDSVSLVL